MPQLRPSELQITLLIAAVYLWLCDKGFIDMSFETAGKACILTLCLTMMLRLLGPFVDAYSQGVSLRSALSPRPDTIFATSTLPPVIAKPAPVIEHFDVPILVRHGTEKQLGRLIIERGRDEYKGTAYLHGGSYHKVHYVGNPVNGGFSHLTSEDFLKKVRDLFASGSAIEFEFPPADTAVEWDNIKQEVEGSR